MEDVLSLRCWRHWGGGNGEGCPLPSWSWALTAGPADKCILMCSSFKSSSFARENGNNRYLKSKEHWWDKSSIWSEW